MKKLTFTLMLLIAFSTFVFADGETPGGGKTCPPPQTVCREDEPTDGGLIKFITDLLTDLIG